MSNKKILFFLITTILLYQNSNAQSAPPASGAAMAATRDAAIAVNNFTGIPSIGVPIFSYAHSSGIGVSVSLDYFAGGIKVGEAPSPVGLGWNLSVGGVITRTVRGIADDAPNRGFLYTPSFPLDSRADQYKYYNGCTDAEQDIFQFNFAGRSGKFYLGKNGQVFLLPLSKMKIEFTKRDITLLATGSKGGPNPIDYDSATIVNFTITTEDGAKYFFNEMEYQFENYVSCSPSISVSLLNKYGAAWYLTKILSPARTDSITFNYVQSLNFYKYGGTPTQSVQIKNGATTINPTPTTTGLFGNYGSTSSKIPTLNTINLPDNKSVQFVYSGRGQFRFTLFPVLQRIKVFDSTGFKYGYKLNWDTTNVGNLKRNFLTGISYYNSSIEKAGYEFYYNGPHFFINGADTLQPYGIDHWGFYNGASNGYNAVPTIPGIYVGANREPNSAAIAGSISSVKDPSGGTTFYQFENNDAYPYQSQKAKINIDASQSTVNNCNISRLLGQTTYFRILFDSSFDRTITCPITGQGELVVKLTNLDGSIVYNSTTINLIELFYNGSSSFSFTIPAAIGLYKIRTNLGVGSASSLSLPINITWYNQISAASTTNTIGGIRIKQVRHFDPLTNKIDTLATYKYILSNGLSSGFFGAKPVYDYYLSPDTRMIVSQPINDFDYGDGNKIGYGRVEIIKGSEARNLGKQVIEYTNLVDNDCDISPAEYPFMPRVQRSWTFGLPKKTMVYDNTGRLIQSTKNVFSYTSVSTNGDSNFVSQKVGRITENSLFNGAASYNFIAEKYYLESGRADLIRTLDTFYHPDNSIITSSKDIAYDTNYNTIKITKPFNLNKNLNIEQRMYYPYNYTLGGAIGTLRDSGIYVPVATETWITGDANPRMISTSISDLQKVSFLNKYPLLIKPITNYALQTSVPLPQSASNTFNPALLVRDTIRMLPQQNSMYDKKGMLLQVTNQTTGTSNSIIYGYNSTKPIAKVSNAKYADIAYTSFENDGNSSWSFGTAAILDSSSTITGRYAGSFSYNTILSKVGLNPVETYLISCWVKNGSVFTSGATNVKIEDQRNGWTLYTMRITATTIAQVYVVGLIDELRLYPINANMETICYNTDGEVNTTCDANNGVSYFEYDILNRIKITRDKDKNIIKKFEYSDVLTLISLAPIWVANDSLNWACSIIVPDASPTPFGMVYRMETDMNPNSEGYLLQRFVPDHIDFNRCPAPTISCGSNPALKSINGVCEIGQKVVTSTYRKKNYPPMGPMYFSWVCTYHYHWSDNSDSINYTEESPSGCSYVEN